MEVGSEVTAREGLAWSKSETLAAVRMKPSGSPRASQATWTLVERLARGCGMGKRGGLYAPYAPRPVAERVSVSPERRRAGAAQVALKISVL